MQYTSPNSTLEEKNKPIILKDNLFKKFDNLKLLEIIVLENQHFISKYFNKIIFTHNL